MARLKSSLVRIRELLRSIADIMDIRRDAPAGG